MSRYLFFLGLTILGCIHFSTVQGQNLTGTVLNETDSLPIPGVNVSIKGTTFGTVTDMDGKFSLTLQNEDDTLVISAVGMEVKEIQAGNLSKLVVVLQEEIYRVNEVVVTALGISKQSKSLGYSVESITADEITEGKDRSFLNALQGKVAGVNISSASGAPGSSTRILIRGISSLGRSNQPLFVIDGIPLSNSFSGSTSINGGNDFGNKANDLNPEDIASISVLKGAAGTALYGSRAANGVIVIETKKGKAVDNKFAEVIFSSAFAIEEPLRLIQYQNEFGQGIDGDAVGYENMSWGPEFDKVNRIWGYMVDSTIRVKPYVALPNNVREFFDIGKMYSNSLSITGGNDQATYYFSYSNIAADGIFPTNSDNFNKHTFALRGSLKVSDRLKSSASLNYIKKTGGYVSTGQGGQSVYNQIMNTPRDISLLELEDVEYKFNNIDNYYSLYSINPYFVLNENGNKNDEDRVFGNINLEYKLLEGLKAQVRLGGDIANENFKSWRAVLKPEGNNENAFFFEPGRVSEYARNRSTLNNDLLLSYEHSFGDFDLSILVGQNINASYSHTLSATVNTLTTEGFYNLNNSPESPVVNEYTRKQRLVGAYSSVDLAYRSLLFLSMTARNDWSSTLPKENNSFFYPGANLGFIFTELMPGFRNILPFGKLRVGYAQTGNDAPPYSIYSVYDNGVHSDGYGSLRYPLNGVDAYEVSTLLGNDQLKPELTKEYEIGTDLRFFKNRIGIDFTYYNSTITDLIWAAPLSSASGYTRQYTNLGKITNQGIELLLEVKPVKSKWFDWEMSFNFSKNINELVSLNSSLEEVTINNIGVSGGQQINYLGKPGRPIGVFEARTIETTEDGKMVVDNQGVPVAAEELIEYGDSEYDYILGATNTFTIFGIRLSGTFDIRQGGIMYSRTKDISGWAGTIPATLYNSREPFIVPNSVYEIDQDKNGEPIYAENTIPLGPAQLQSYWANGGTELDGFALIDKSYIKLREASARYAVPAKWLNKLPIEGASFSIVGKNLYLWTPDDQIYIDPEVTTFGNDIASNFGEYSATPSIRSVTFGLKLIF